MPSLYIITGSNGAGKSSIGPEYIPFELRKLIFDGDLLFMKKKVNFGQVAFDLTRNAKN
jgi:predicted ABC-type ATPase